jgi:cellulose synthase (UDP-forming)
VLILDADHVPTVDFLENTVGIFIDDAKMFLVQTPHFFINPDPVERNLKLFSRMPSENEMFYRAIQHGLDFWNASFFCGSAAVLRRKYLDEIGGISGESITEDAETALTLHGRGYHSAYIGRPMIAGLQPETYSGFVVQRVRWAQGMMQIMILKNPLLQKGLAPWQRLSYFSSAFFWFFAYARVIFVLAPAAYFIFGMHIYNANIQQFFVYAMPHIIAAMYVSDFLFGKMRWAFISELYELMQAFYSLSGLVRVFRNPHSPTFTVTPKGEQLEDDFISKLSAPFYAVMLLTVASLAFGIYRYFHFPLDHDVIEITMAWELFNMTILLAALGALYERRQRRAVPRMPAHIEAQVSFNGIDWLPCVVDDLSVGGAAMRVKYLPDTALYCPIKINLRIYNVALGYVSELTLLVKKCNIDARKKSWLLGAAFVIGSDAVKAEVVGLVLGDSQRWEDFLQSRGGQGKTVLRAYGFLLKIGINGAATHFFEIIQIGIRFLLDLIGASLVWLYKIFANKLTYVTKWVMYK